MHRDHVRVVADAAGHVDRCVRRRELDGIRDQIDDHLQDAVGIDQQLRGRGLHGDPDAGAIGHRLHRLGGLLEQLGDLHRLAAQLHAARLHLLQIEDVVDQPAEAVGVGERDVEHALPLRRGIAQQARAEEADGAADGGEWCAQLVADGGDEFVLHALDHQPLADVAEGDDDTGGGAGVVDDCAGGVFDGDQGAVEAHELAPAGANGGIEVGAADLALVIRQRTVRARRAVDGGVEAAADQAGHVPAEDFHGGGIHERDDAGEVEAEDAFARGVEDGLIALHGGAQLLGAGENLALQVDLIGLQRQVALADLLQHLVERLLHGAELVVVAVRPLGHAHGEVFVAAHALRGAGQVAQRHADQPLQPRGHEQRQQQGHGHEDRAGGDLGAHPVAHFAQVGDELQRADLLVAIDDGVLEDDVALVLRGGGKIAVRGEHAPRVVENGAGDGGRMRAHAGHDLRSGLDVVEHHRGGALRGHHRSEHLHVADGGAAQGNEVVDDERGARRAERAGRRHHDDGAHFLANGKVAQRPHRIGPTMRASARSCELNAAPSARACARLTMISGRSRRMPMPTLTPASTYSGTPVMVRKWRARPMRPISPTST